MGAGAGFAGGEGTGASPPSGGGPPLGGCWLLGGGPAVEGVWPCDELGAASPFEAPFCPGDAWLCTNVQTVVFPV